MTRKEFGWEREKLGKRRSPGPCRILFADRGGQPAEREGFIKRDASHAGGGGNCAGYGVCGELRDKGVELIVAQIIALDTLR